MNRRRTLACLIAAALLPLWAKLEPLRARPPVDFQITTMDWGRKLVVQGTCGNFLGACGTEVSHMGPEQRTKLSLD